ncbi:MAG: MarR family transcriptional regulator [Mycobacterium sp.]|uniref:GbsR/MarR family transcriptional regulator n=1 Tax=Mycobacterium sp. TaxID=1785 RepID=UPI003C5CEF32
MSPDEAEFVDRMGLFFETIGATRTMGRLYGWLMICDPPQQSLSELATALSVSKASVSTVARQLQEGGMIERLPSATRQHRYRITPGGFTHVLNVQLTLMGSGILAADFGLQLLGDDKAEQRERLQDFRDFCEFSASDYRDELTRRWEQFRTERRSQ